MVKVKKTLLLDSDTIEILEQYGLQTSGSKNLSSSVRTMAREYKKEHKEELQKDKQEF